MSKAEENPVEGAVGGISPDDLKFLEALHLLGIKPPRPDDPGALGAFLSAFRGRQPEKTEPTESSERIAKPSYHFPRLSSFRGEEGKDTTTWQNFKWEVESLLDYKVYTDEQIQFGIRQAFKGPAADKLRRLGPHIKAEEILVMLDLDYGAVESKESVLRKFYSCEQKPEESVESYTTRLEDLFERAVKLRGLKKSDDTILKEVFHAGLVRDLKLMTMYQKDVFESYWEMKQAIRKLQEDLKTSTSDAKKTLSNAAVYTDTRQEPKEKKQEKSELSEVKDMLKRINERIDRLEKVKEEQPEDRPGWYKQGRGNGGQQHFQRGRGRGRGDFRRPLGSETFQPLCFICNERGHIQRKCPLITSQFVCTGCKEKGHQRKDCPN